MSADMKDGMRLRGCLAAGLILLASVVFCPASDDQSGEGAALLVSPRAPAPGRMMRVLAAAEIEIEKARLEVRGPSGKIEAARIKSGGGPPYWWSAEFPVAGEGSYEVALVVKGKTLASTEVLVEGRRRPAANPAGPGDVGHGWNRRWENLYSAWIDALFSDADERASWTALQEVTRDAARNVLHDHLGLGEDDPASPGPVVMKPDCADCPFFLRAYFSWKTGLPFGFHETDRGTLERAPRPGRWQVIASWPRGMNAVAAFNALLRNVMNAVHSGTARTRLEDDASDDYPVPLSREALRPGIVFADPYGHTLVIVRWVPQTGKKAGQLLAVDAQPDGTVGLKRFWPGNFLFETTGVVGEPGFKAFRPIVLEGKAPRLLPNREIAADPGYGNFSLQQKGLKPGAFYDTMERLMNPKPLDPEAAFREQFEGLFEQLIVRVDSVANGEAYMASHPGVIISMPGTAAGVFLAGGPWEDFSTPNRDLRVLIAMEAVRDFPDKVVRSPDLYRLPKRRTPEEIKAELAALAAKWGRELEITYIRSNGASQVLTVNDVLARAEALEMAYNPNDGIEIRWGAPAGSAELSSCRRHAPASQAEKMKAMRSWFRKRLHPPT
jgi:hypothetical protein